MAKKQTDTPSFTSAQRYSDNSVVFEGEHAEWQAYLERPYVERYEPDISIQIEPLSGSSGLKFATRNHNQLAEELAILLNQGLALLDKRLAGYPVSAEILSREVYANSANTVVPVVIKCSPHVPIDATREIVLQENLEIQAVSVVLNRELVQTVINAYQQVSEGKKYARLGVLWGLLRPLLHELGHSNLPRDRFFEEIHRVWCDCIVMRNLLFRDKIQEGKLAPNKAGETYLKLYLNKLLKQDEALGIENWSSLPFFKMLNHLNRFVHEEMLKRNRALKLIKNDDFNDPAKVIIRGYLDDKYLRPSLAQTMSEIPEAYKPMKISWNKRGPETPSPKIGRYGIEDEEDLSAWKKLANKFKKIGLLIVSQLGIGEFGRVYEALNLSNPSWPERVAVKVDRIYKKRKKQAIQVEAVMLRLTQDLSNSPHVIRVYDTGLLSKKYTYHVLQLVAEGETLDELLGIGKEEPTSKPGKFSQEETLGQLKQKFLKPVIQLPKKKNHRFARPLTLNETIDVMVSLLLWVEKVHMLGYTVNDIKTGNVMINCRGQLKGIDLDFYQKSPNLPQAYMQDFFLLSWSCLFLLINAPRGEALPVKRLKAEFGDALQDGADALAKALAAEWLFKDLNATDGRQILDCFLELIFRMRTNVYGAHRELFEHDINKLVYLKRLFFEREIILTTPKYLFFRFSGESF
jgi:hypothetical protein